MMEFYHEPIMAKECIDALDIKAGGIYVDGTLGGGGHSELIAKKLKDGRLICIDRDLDAIRHASERLSEFKNIDFAHDNFTSLHEILRVHEIRKIDGILLDLGVSSFQLDNAERGFSYMKAARLDMRMDRTSDKSAFEIVNEYSEDELKKILFEYGEERFSKRIASFIIEERQRKPIQTTLELVEIIERAIPKSKRVKGSHPAKRTFQAIRIEVNSELSGLYEFITSLTDVLNEKGRIAVITFHSLEDRIVKRAFYDLQNPCKCPAELPVCVCGKKSLGRNVFRKPLAASDDEVERNSRAKSAKLRVFECK